MTSCSTLPTNNQKDVRITKHISTHKIYTTQKRQITSNNYLSKILNQKPNDQHINKTSNHKKIIIK
jgi:hypothetical protein